ncbi:MAG: 2-hydroxymuconate tautomerase [Phycicoccus sp.]
MPIVTIALMKGRPPEAIEAMTRAVSHAVAEAIEAPIETVRVMVHEMDDHQYAVGGRPIAEVKAERAHLAPTRGGPSDEQQAGARADESTRPGEPEARAPGGAP